MSQAIHHAQTAKSILHDTSLPAGERLQRAFDELWESDFEQLDEATLERLWADLDQIDAAVDHALSVASESGKPLEKEEFDECKAPLDSLDSLAPRLHEMLDSAATRLIEAELDRIITELDVDFHVLPEAAIREAREHRDLIVPRLIKVLQDAIARVRAGGIPEKQAHFFAVFLLTEFQAEEAFEIMLEAFSLDENLSFELFGDALDDIPMRMLAVFRGDRPDAIEALIDDSTINTSLRWQAASSYLYLVREGHIDRDEAVRRLQGSLRRAIDNNDGNVAGPLICELDNYAPVEALREIREAFECGLVEEFMIDMSDIERSIAGGSARLEEHFDRCGPAAMDTLEELKSWSAVEPEPPARPAGEPSPLSSFSPLGTALPAPRLEDDEPLPAKQEPIVASGPRIGRNDPCPCGSGKKFKKCCGARV